MKLKLRYKGGPGSGHRGHAGRPGSVGGSVVGVGGAVATPIANMMALWQEQEGLKNSLKYSKSVMRQAESKYWKKRNEPNKARLDKARARFAESDDAVRKNKEALKAHGKTKASGFGDWKPDSERSSAASTSWTRVRIYVHPKYGEVRRVFQKGASRQKVADSATITFTTPGGDSFRRGWVGTKASNQAKRFIDKHWGTGETL